MLSSERLMQLNLIILSQRRLRGGFTRMSKYRWKKEIPNMEWFFILAEKCHTRFIAWKQMPDKSECVIKAQISLTWNH